MVNPDQVLSRRNFNRYIIDYATASEQSFISRYLVIETTTNRGSYQNETMHAACFIFDFLSANNADVEIIKYGMEPFNVQVQSIERTFIDKVFAVGDYYLRNQAATHSRHIYDLYKIYPNIIINEKFKDLVKEVREERKPHTTYLSAKDGVDLQVILKKIMDENFYKADYEHLSDTLLFETIAYHDVIAVLGQIIENRYFT